MPTLDSLPKLGVSQGRGRGIGHVLAACGLYFILGAVNFGAAAQSQVPAEGIADSSTRARMAAEQLIRTQLPTGLFPYDLDFVTGAAEDMKDPSGPNIVRQAGALFALAQYLEVSDSPPLRETIARALQGFAQRSLPIGKGAAQSVLENLRVYNRWQIWNPLRAPLDRLGLLYDTKGEGRVVSANGSYERAWPGATALALVSELRYRAATTDDSFAKARHGWLKALLALRVPGRGFREAPHYLTESGYVNGEAWLSLAEYARSFPADQEIVATLSEIEDYLMARYGASPTLQFYHWGVMAASVRARATRDPRFLDFVRSQTEWVLASQGSLLEGSDNTCAWIEGLATAVDMLWRDHGKEDPLQDRARDWIKVIMAHNLALQILPGQDSVSFGNGAIVRSPWLAVHAGAFLTSSKEAKMQVDVTGHCLSALIRMQNAGLADQK